MHVNSKYQHYQDGVCTLIVHSFIRSFIHSFICSFTRSFIHSFVYSFIHFYLYILLSIHPYSYSSHICSFIHLSHITYLLKSTWLQWVVHFNVLEILPDNKLSNQRHGYSDLEHFHDILISTWRVFFLNHGAVKQPDAILTSQESYTTLSAANALLYNYISFIHIFPTSDASSTIISLKSI